MSCAYLNPHLPAVVQKNVLAVVGRVDSLKAVCLPLSSIHLGARTAYSDHFLLSRNLRIFVRCQINSEIFFSLTDLRFEVLFASPSSLLLVKPLYAALLGESLQGVL